jgi:hypothetical protein
MMLTSHWQPCRMGRSASQMPTLLCRTTFLLIDEYLHLVKMYCQQVKDDKGEVWDS